MASSPQVLQLSQLDQIVLRVYVRQLLVFPFSDLNLRKDAQTVLATSLFATFKRFPFLAGTVEIADPATGALTVKYPRGDDEESVWQRLTVNDVDLDDLDYQTLCKEGVPPSRLPADALCPFVLRSHPGVDDQYAEVLTSFSKRQPIPVFAAQINFIRGGLILSAYTHHSVVDGTGIAKIYQVWSSYTRNWNDGLDVPDQTEAPKLDDARLALNALAVGAKEMHLPEFRCQDDPVSPPMRDVAYKISAKLLVFSAATISAFAASLSFVTNVRISQFTALCTLVWCHVTNARREAMEAKRIATTTLGTAIDHRKRVGNLLPDDYLGNCANGMIVHLPLSTMPKSDEMDAEHMAPAALALSSALAAIDLDWFRARLLEVSKREISSKWILNLDTQNGPDLFITSWQHIGADDEWAIPGTTKSEDGQEWLCRPTAIRKPHNLWEGGMQILPRRKGDVAPYEIPLCLEEEEMERALHGLREGKWVERVIDA